VALVNSCTCVCVCVYVCLYVCVCVSLSLSVRVCMCWCMQVWGCEYLGVCVCVCVFVLCCNYFWFSGAIQYLGGQIPAAGGGGGGAGLGRIEADAVLCCKDKMLHQTVRFQLNVYTCSIYAYICVIVYASNSPSVALCVPHPTVRFQLVKYE